MGCRDAAIYVGLLVGMLCLPVHAQPNAAGVEIEQIDAAVRRLAHHRFIERERATEFLWKMGPAAQSALTEAADGENREVAYRARLILERFRYGIYPDTPPATVELLNRFRFGNSSQRRSVLTKLQQDEQQQRIVTLLKTVADDGERLSLQRTVLRNYDKLVSQWLVDNHREFAEEVMRWGITIDASDLRLRDYAAYLFLKGDHLAEIDRLSALEAARTVDETRLLVQLLRIDDQLSKSLFLAHQVHDKSALIDLLMRTHDYESLAEPEYIAIKSPMERLGYSLAMNRLAGNQQELREIAEQIHQLGSEHAVSRSNAAWQASQALMISGLWEEAIDVQRNQGSHLAFVLLCEHMRFDEAFALAGIKDPRHGSAKWFAERASHLEFASPDMTHHIRYGLEVVRALHRLGEEEELLDLLTEIERVSEDQTGDSLMLLFTTELNLGLQESARKHAAATLAHSRKTSLVFTELFGESATALVWWDYFKKTRYADNRLDLLERLERLLKPAEPLDKATVLRLARDADKLSSEMSGPSRSRWLLGIGEMCKTHGQHDLAHEYFSQLSHSTTNLQRIGDLWREQEQWSKASHWYQLAWQADRGRNALPLYLQGYALKQIGKTTEGQELMKLAQLIPRGDSLQRQRLAEGLRKRNLTDAAHQQWKLILRFGSYDYGSYGKQIKEAARFAGDYLNTIDQLKSAELMERRIWCHLVSTLQFKDPRSYPSYIHRIHRTRALGLIEAGQMEQAEDEMWLAHAASPGEVYLPILIVPQLEEAGQLELADALFEKVYQTIRSCCDVYPNSGYLFNRVAWLAARCNRQLEQALLDAQHANRLAPDQAPYLLTLAEVHFWLGHQQRAISFAKQSLELQPGSSYYQSQLERYEQATADATP